MSIRLLFALVTGPVQAATITVTATADSGGGSLTPGWQHPHQQNLTVDPLLFNGKPLLI